MRPALAWLMRLSAAGAALAVVVLAARLHSTGTLSLRRLEAALAPGLDAVVDLARLGLRSSAAVPAAAFAVGMLAGWMLAIRWMGDHSRRRSLLLADLRGPDMPFLDGVRHVRARANVTVRGDDEAARLILQEAGRGRLTVWRPASSNSLRRVSRRQLRARTAHPPQDVLIAEELHGLRLLRMEMERLWPESPVVDGKARNLVESRRIVL